MPKKIKLPTPKNPRISKAKTGSITRRTQAFRKKLKSFGNR